VSVVITCIAAPEGGDVVVTGPAERIWVHRALAADAPFRYITVGASAPMVQPAGGAAPREFSGRYELFHRRDEPAAPFDPDSIAPAVTFINCMRFDPAGHDEAFAVWQQINAYMVTKPGYRWHKLHRRVDPDAPFGLVNVARWESEAAWRAAHDDGFRALAARPDLPFEPVPTLCELVDDSQLQPAGPNG
jgi:heme-degrading monooxygenase HmoA